MRKAQPIGKNQRNYHFILVRCVPIIREVTKIRKSLHNFSTVCYGLDLFLENSKKIFKYY